jgi:hypothetical protein
MTALLSHLGFKVNERTRRAPCILCGGDNPTEFSWREDGRWHCFRCSEGGDKLALIMKVTGTSFPDAVKVLAQSAGLSGSGGVEWGGPSAQEKRRRARLEAAAEKYHVLERLTRLALAQEVRSLALLRDRASERLGELRRGARERVHGEVEFAWGALALAQRESLPALAAYTLAAFGCEEDRQRFVLNPPEREGLIEGCLLRGGVVGDSGEFVGLPV